jgi:hypothetical protein
MRIGLVGGRERNEVVYQRLALAAGHFVEFHSGDVGGRGSATLEALCERVDLLVVVTDINSHGAVQQARRLVRRHQLRFLLLRRCGMSRFATLLEAMSIEERRLAGHSAGKAAL